MRPRELPALRVLQVTSHGLSTEGMEIFAHLIRALKQLHVIDLSGNELGVEGVLEMARCLDDLPKLRELNIQDNGLTREAIKASNIYKYMGEWRKLWKVRKTKGGMLIADGCVAEMLEEH